MIDVLHKKSVFLDNKNWGPKIQAFSKGLNHNLGQKFQVFLYLVLVNKGQKKWLIL